MKARADILCQLVIILSLTSSCSFIPVNMEDKLAIEKITRYSPIKIGDTYEGLKTDSFDYINCEADEKTSGQTICVANWKRTNNPYEIEFLYYFSENKLDKMVLDFTFTDSASMYDFFSYIDNRSMPVPPEEFKFYYQMGMAKRLSTKSEQCFYYFYKKEEIYKVNVQIFR